ncbi:PREDICTED: MAU2 chromatid cohesion factor homolog [Branchiostoma belcheri]|uniref:MAU2 chromatid cohesion factor homolog n=1 Tax=Branchiostoma belcheri TaxID=7741 RepID=A0A6P4Z6W2_BRABE|nr:PREDICTED: MAU2 chromatid cohesion factor homolog [Branchiostoma belcheri]KAI8480790.1 mau2 chromatid cohesion factor [Branchiostoma belcheri]
MAAVPLPQHQNDSWYLSLLGLAESFRTANPPKIKLCIHCLESIFQFNPPPGIEARTHLQLGSLLFTHTKNTDLARSHLEKAWLLTQTVPGFDDVRYEAAAILANLYYKHQNQIQLAKSLLRKAISTSQPAPYWHFRLLFQLAQIHAWEGDNISACELLGHGAESAAMAGAYYTSVGWSSHQTNTRVMFMLSKAMLLLMDKKFHEVHPLLALCNSMLESWTGHPTHRETLRVYLLVLQVTNFLMVGQVKSVKPYLKQLQQSIQTITALHTDDEPPPSHPADLFQWLPKEHMCVLVYLVTVMHSMQAGYMDKAQKYTDKALMQIEKLKILDSSPILSTFQLMLLEHIIMCRLVMGQQSIAVQEISQACHVCHEQPKLFVTHGAQLHTLLGLYAMSMGCLDSAEGQLNAALRIMSNTMAASRLASSTHARPQTESRLSQQPELWMFTSLNLAIVYLRSGKNQQLLSLLERINPDTYPSSSHAMTAAGYYIRGLQSFFQERYHEAKRYLRETLKMSNAEDLNRLTSCSLVLLGHIFLSLGNSRESMNMVLPAMQLASKIPDVDIQMWSAHLLKDLYHMMGDPIRAGEGGQMHYNFSQQQMNERFRSSQQIEHNLIQWLDGPCPMHLAVTDGPSHSGTIL